MSFALRADMAATGPVASLADIFAAARTRMERHSVQARTAAILRGQDGGMDPVQALVRHILLPRAGGPNRAVWLRGSFDPQVAARMASARIGDGDNRVKTAFTLAL